MKKLLTFLEQSNAIEHEFSAVALLDAIDAWQYAVSHRSLTVDKLLGIHKRLAQHLRPDIAGTLRECQVYVGDHTPPQYYLLAPMLAGLFQWVPKTEKECEQWHVEFEKIHPFEDFNGRTGRIIWNAQRLRLKLPLKIIHVGAEQREYYKLFL